MPYKTKFIPENPSKYIGNSANIICRSLWERKVCKWLDSNKNVLRWASEEIKIPYLSPKDNKIHHYYPDFLAEVKNKQEEIETFLIEVKPKKQTKPPKEPKRKTKNFIRESLTYEINKSKWESAKKYCIKKGWKFLLLTEQEIFGDKNDPKHND